MSFKQSSFYATIGTFVSEQEEAAFCAFGSDNNFGTIGIICILFITVGKGITTDEYQSLTGRT
jgi:hypothetical protein